jgi:DNA-binding transcriptional LysR family regulator
VLPFLIQAYAAPSPAWPLAHPRGLAAQPLLLATPSAETTPLRWLHAASGRSAQVDVEPVVTSEDMDGLMALARAGGGIVLAPSYCAQVDLMQDRLINVLPGWHLPVAEGSSVQALTLPQPLASESARTLVRYVRDALAASPLR